MLSEYKYIISNSTYAPVYYRLRRDTNLSRCSKQIRSFATFSLLDIVFLRFSTVSVRSTVRSNCPPVVGVMLMVISSGSRTVAATQPHPGCAGDDVGEEEEEEDNDDDEDEAAGSGDAEPALIEPWPQRSCCDVE